MRVFHTYTHTPKGLYRGLEDFNTNVMCSGKIETVIQDKLKTNSHLRILEIGAGKGVLLLQLANLFPSASFTGVNKLRSHGTMNETERLTLSRKLKITLLKRPRIIISNATSLPFENSSFDFVLSQVTFHHVKDKLRALQEIARVLKVGGEAHIDLDTWQFKKNKPKGAVPEFYQRLFKSLGKESLPRLIIINKQSQLLPLKKFLKTTIFSISLRRKTCHNKSTYYEPYFTFTLHLKKKKNGTLKFPCRRNSKLSRQLTNLPIIDHNPASYGVVDVYQA